MISTTELPNLKLPSLLEETSRPSQKHLNKLYSYVNKWRYYLFRLWKESSPALPDTTIEAAINQIVGMVFLLGYCRRANEPNIKLLPIANSNGTISLHELQQQIAASFSCPILKEVFNFKTAPDITIPKSLFQKNWEHALRFETWCTFHDEKLPLWFFGDYHQLCVANPPQNGFQRQRSSETRYARGINYTPAALVDYLTVTSIDSASEKMDLDKIRIIDPTCGCASFLMAAFRYLVQKQACKGQRVLDLLKQSIFGVDIDEGAVAWSTRLLWLTAKQFIDDSRQMVVPNLQDNIKLGSFLDLYKGSESFDVILGSPPFVRLSEMKRSQAREIDRYQREFESARHGQFDLYMLILEKSLQLLSKVGELGYSLSNTFIRSDSGGIIRRIIERETTIREIIEFEDKQIYADAATQIALLRLSKGTVFGKTRYVHVDGKKNHTSALRSIYGQDPDNKNIEIRYFAKQTFQKPNWNLRPANKMIDSGIPISSLPIKIVQGVSTPLDRFFMLQDKGVLYPHFAFGLTRDGKEVKFEREMLRPIIRGRQTRGFWGAKCEHVVVFPYTEDYKIIKEEILRDQFPLTYAYLESIRPHIKNGTQKPWYRYRSSNFYCTSRKQIICSKITAARGFSFFEKEKALLHTGVFGCVLASNLNPYVVLATLNSSTFWEYVLSRMPTSGDGYRSIRMPAFKEFKLPRVVMDTPAAVAEEGKFHIEEIRKSLFGHQQDKFKDLCKNLDQYVERLYSM